MTSSINLQLYLLNKAIDIIYLEVKPENIFLNTSQSIFFLNETPYIIVPDGHMAKNHVGCTIIFTKNLYRFI